MIFAFKLDLSVNFLYVLKNLRKNYLYKYFILKNFLTNFII